MQITGAPAASLPTRRTSTVCSSRLRHEDDQVHHELGAEAVNVQFPVEAGWRRVYETVVYVVIRVYVARLCVPVRVVPLAPGPVEEVHTAAAQWVARRLTGAVAFLVAGLLSRGWSGVVRGRPGLHMAGRIHRLPSPVIPHPPHVSRLHGEQHRDDGQSDGQVERPGKQERGGYRPVDERPDDAFAQLPSHTVTVASVGPAAQGRVVLRRVGLGERPSLPVASRGTLRVAYPPSPDAEDRMSEATWPRDNADSLQLPPSRSPAAPPLGPERVPLATMRWWATTSTG